MRDISNMGLMYAVELHDISSLSTLNDRCEGDDKKSTCTGIITYTGILTTGDVNIQT